METLITEKVKYGEIISTVTKKMLSPMNTIKGKFSRDMHKFGIDIYTNLCNSTISFPWKRKWQPTPVFLPGESHGRRNLVGYSSRGRKESDTTERLHSLTIS